MQRSAPSPAVRRWLVLALILIAFCRLVWRLDAKSLWWDESLSLQRAEAPWPTLLVGRLTFDDGVTQLDTLDQHPPAFFASLGVLVRLAGDTEFVLRFPSVVAATLLVPMLWSLARLLVRQRLLPPAAPIWAALFAAVNPFFLWYGREARAYTLVSLLAILSTYLLLRWGELYPRAEARRIFVAYAFTIAVLLGTHYFAVLILPIHAALIVSYVWPRNRRHAVLMAIGMLALGLAYGVVAGVSSLKAPGSGLNFSFVALPIMAADLLNAFSLGLSVDIAQVRWLDYLFGLVALVGALWCWRPQTPHPRDRWLLPALLLLPVIFIQLVQIIHPAYMNARHMSLVSGIFVLLVGGGVAAIWNWRAWAGVILGVVLVAGTLYSTVNYFVSPQYAKDNFAEVGAELRREMQPGDAVILLPVEMLRMYRYYLPVGAGGQPGRLTDWLGAPLLGNSLEDTQESISSLIGGHRRTWLVVSGMVPFNSLRPAIEDWLLSEGWLARETGFQSNTVLTLRLFLPQKPVQPALPDNVRHPVDVVFGDQVRLAGYDAGKPLSPDSSVPITLYWQAAQPIERRYKYILRLLADDGKGGFESLATTEREPYDGNLPTTSWETGQTIVEFSELPPFKADDALRGRVPRLSLQVYDAESLTKLPVSHAGAGVIALDAETILLPYEPE